MIFPLFCNGILVPVQFPIVDAIGVDDFPFSRLISAQKDLVSFINNFRARLSAWAFDSDAFTSTQCLLECGSCDLHIAMKGSRSWTPVHSPCDEAISGIGMHLPAVFIPPRDDVVSLATLSLLRELLCLRSSAPVLWIVYMASTEC